HQWVGLNSRLDTLQAAILNVKLDHLAGWSEARRANAAYYNEKLAGIPQVKIPYIVEKAVTIYNQYTLICAERDALLEHLKDRDIGCAVYYPKPLHLQECFAELGYKEGDLPVAEQTARQVLSIPIYPELTEAQKLYVFDAIRDFYRRMDQ
nr:DegT/DnrJ/EryC1/StrS family aminotransferase [Candidatus Syntrophosphaera sp.]